MHLPNPRVRRRSGGLGSLGTTWAEFAAKSGGPAPFSAEAMAVNAVGIGKPYGGKSLKSMFHVNAQYTPTEQGSIQQEMFRVANWDVYVPGVQIGRGGGPTTTYGQTLGGPYPTDEDRAFAAAFVKQRPDMFSAPKDFMDKISKGLEIVVEAIVIAGISYGAYMAAMQAAAPAASTAGSTASTSSAASAAASDAGTLYAPASAVAPGGSAVSAGTVATSGTATTAAGVAKTAAGYMKTAKDIIGVAQVVRSVASKPNTAIAASPTLDSQYGVAAPVAAPSLMQKLTSGNTPLYIGGALLAILATVALARR